jgi:hypothetical protein
MILAANHPLLLSGNKILPDLKFGIWELRFLGKLFLKNLFRLNIKIFLGGGYNNSI